MHTEKWYSNWMAGLKPGDNVHVGSRDRSKIYLWTIDEINGDIASINGFEFDLTNGYGPPGKLFFPTDATLERYRNQGLAEEIESLCGPGDLTHLSRDVLNELKEIVLEMYEEAGHVPFGPKKRASHYAGKS